MKVTMGAAVGKGSPSCVRKIAAAVSLGVSVNIIVPTPAPLPAVRRSVLPVVASLPKSKAPSSVRLPEAMMVRSCPLVLAVEKLISISPR